MYRHGDVLILDAQPLPTKARRRMSNVVAEGEATGHAHRLVAGEVWEEAGNVFLVAKDGAALTHEEHARLSLAPTPAKTAYPAIIQREYDDEKEWRQVAD